EQDRRSPREKRKPPRPADAREPGPHLALADRKSRFGERLDQRHGNGSVLHLMVPQEGREKLVVAAVRRLQMKAAALAAPAQDGVRRGLSCPFKVLVKGGPRCSPFTPPALLVHPYQGTRKVAGYFGQNTGGFGMLGCVHDRDAR